MGGACSSFGGELYTGFWWGNLRRKRPLGRPRCRRTDNNNNNNNNMDLQEVGDGGMDCMDLAQDRNRWRALVNAVKNLRVPKNVRIFLTS